ncbi:MAG: DEAD/DEAH box helicase [Candidatus Saganbacteria bacterium]|nr:DEAD/DEAH box helicase [Candidatus Saganbacteria bacterium]
MTNETFHGLGIAPGILEVLNRLKFTKPTPIQQKAIPIATSGKDIIGIAQTGTGKTLAFGIPLIQRLAQQSGKGLILVPTRELAGQVYEALIKLTQVFRIRAAVLVGGENMGKQLYAIRSGARIIIATPGRLNDHIARRNIRMDDVNVLVLDEADRMLDMGFAPQIDKIIKYIPKQRQTMLFSATMPSTIVAMVSRYMQLPVRTEIAPEGTAAENVSQEMFIVRRELKSKLLEELLLQYKGSVLLFIRTKMGAKKIARFLKDIGHNAAEIHSDKTLAQRREALSGFKSGRFRILVATDIAARGIDVQNIEVVINYDLPDDPENYVHRIGRTGRAGAEGHAITFATPDQSKDIKNIERLIRAVIPLSQHPVIPGEKFSTVTMSFAPRGRRPQGSFRRRSTAAPRRPSRW